VGLRPILSPPEPKWLGRTCVVIAVLIAATFLYASTFYWVGVHPGVDQNGYLVGGKQIARTLTMKLAPTLPGTSELDPHGFVGRMWVGADLLTEHERYYPKYPAGLPLIYAICLWIGGGKLGPVLVYWVSPLAMAIAVWMTFWLGRRLAGSIAGLVAMLLFATSPATLALTTNPNSHATAVCFVVSGMFFLLQWCRRGKAWRAFSAGLLLGCAVTVRYSEGTLLLAMAVAAVMKLMEDRRSALPQAAMLGLGWLIPVGALVSYNLGAMGTVTGYDPTKESLGFSLDYALDNWETMLRQLATVGLFFALPLAFAGLVAMFFRSTKTALIMLAWILPAIVVYTFYYWAPDTSTVGYVRFYLTILPALTAIAAWCGRAVIDAVATRSAAAGAFGGFAVIVAVACAAQLRQGLEIVEADHANRLLVETNVRQITSHIPEGSMIVCGEFNFLHHLQFVRDDVLFSGETFTRGAINSLIKYDPAEPSPLDPQRREAIARRFGTLDQAALDAEQVRLINAALKAGKRVFYVLPLREGTGLPDFLKRQEPTTQPATQPSRRGGRREEPDEPFRRNWPEILRRMPHGDRFVPTLVYAWNMPPLRPAADRTAPRARRTEIRPDRRNGYWQIVEITVKREGLGRRD
jgi:hypothetical protein